ncbi:MAG: hypothetical protein OHK0032_05680 [Thermodesulfovibrionales bacterium]
MPKKIKHRNKSAIKLPEQEMSFLPEMGIAEIITEYASPLLEEAKDIKSYEAALSMAMLCWNIASMPEELREGSLEDAIKRLARTEEDRTFLDSLFRFMIKRKLLLFPDTNV